MRIHSLVFVLTGVTGFVGVQTASAEEFEIGSQSIPLECAFAPVEESAADRSNRLARCYPQGNRGDGRRPLSPSASGAETSPQEAVAREETNTSLSTSSPRQDAPYRNSRMSFGLQTDFHRVPNRPADDNTGFLLGLEGQDGDLQMSVSLGNVESKLTAGLNASRAYSTGDTTSIVGRIDLEASPSVGSVAVGGGLMIHDPTYRDSVTIEALTGFIRDRDTGRDEDRIEGGQLGAQVTTQVDLIQDLVQLDGKLRVVDMAVHNPEIGASSNSRGLYSRTEARLTYLIPNSRGFVSIEGSRETKDYQSESQLTERVLRPDDSHLTVGLRAGAAY